MCVGMSEHRTLRYAVVRWSCTAVGAGAGYVIGRNTGSRSTGTAIGAAVGAGGGYLIGKGMDDTDAEEKAKREEEERRRLETEGTPPPAPK